MGNAVSIHLVSKKNLTNYTGTVPEKNSLFCFLADLTSVRNVTLNTIYPEHFFFYGLYLCLIINLLSEASAVISQATLWSQAYVKNPICGGSCWRLDP